MNTDFLEVALSPETADDFGSCPKPNLFIIGAPKCATSTVFEVLRRDEQCYMPAAVKEPMFLAGELYEKRPPATPDCLEDYLKLFSPARERDPYPKIIGEASTSYLYSPQAVRNALNLSPDARFIVILRHPLDLIEAFHRQLVATGLEEEVDLGKALELESERLTAPLAEEKKSYLLHTQYSKLAEFGFWLSQHRKTIPEERLLILFLEDLQKDAESFYSSIYAFLGLNRPAEFADIRVNPARPIRHAVAVERFKASGPGRKLLLWRQQMKKKGETNPALSRMERSLGGLYNRLLKKDLMERGRVPEQWVTEFKPRFLADLSVLEEICGRDLTHWKARFG